MEESGGEACGQTGPKSEGMRDGCGEGGPGAENAGESRMRRRTDGKRRKCRKDLDQPSRASERASELSDRDADGRAGAGLKSR